MDQEFLDWFHDFLVGMQSYFETGDPQETISEVEAILNLFEENIPLKESTIAAADQMISDFANGLYETELLYDVSNEYFLGVLQNELDYVPDKIYEFLVPDPSPEEY